MVWMRSPGHQDVDGFKAKVLTATIIPVLFMLSHLSMAEEFQFEAFKTTESSSLVVTHLENPAPEDQPFLERQLNASPNFAGKYVLTYWGCGTSCQKVAAIDVETGKVFLPGDGGASAGVCFQRDSRLLIINPIDKESAQQIPDWFYTVFYEITDDGFRLLGKTRAGLSFSCVEY